MRQSNKKSFFYNKIFLIPLIPFGIYSSGYALSTVYLFHILFEAFFAYLFLYAIVAIHFKEKMNFFTISFILFFVMILATFLNAGMTTSITYLTLIFKIIIAFGIVSLYEFEDFIKIFRYTIVVVSVVSLIGYFIINILNTSMNLPVINNVNNVPYAVGYIFFYITEIPERNMGIFWEPGLFATFLIIALVFELVFKKTKPNILIIILLMATVITTNSSAGYGLLLFVPCLAIIKYSSAIKDKYLRFIATGGSFLVASITILNYSNIFEVLGLSENPTVLKIMGDQIGEQSRMLAINHNLSLFIEKPIFGLGFGEAYEKAKYFSDTSTSTFLLAVFGLLGAIYTLLWMIGVMNYKIQINKTINILILIVFLLILNKEPHLDILSTWCILFYFLKPAFKKISFQASDIHLLQRGT